MPKNKRESLLFTFIMCFLMVLWMSIYNVARAHGGFSAEVVVDAWIGFAPAYVFAMLCDWFVASPLCQGFRVQAPRDARQVEPACHDVRGLYRHGLSNGHHHEPLRRLRGSSPTRARWPSFPRRGSPTSRGISSWRCRGTCSLPGPLARFVFRHAFPEGTVLAEPQVG